MAVPKKRTGHSAQGHRRSNWKATTPATTKCPKCGETQLTHTVCTACGYYKGKAVSIKSPDYVATPVETKKATKKAAPKKAEKVVVEETKVEEVVEVVEEKVEATETVEETKEETTTEE